MSAETRTTQFKEFELFARFTTDWIGTFYEVLEAGPRPKAVLARTFLAIGQKGVYIVRWEQESKSLRIRKTAAAARAGRAAELSQQAQVHATVAQAIGSCTSTFVLIAAGMITAPTGSGVVLIGSAFLSGAQCSIAGQRAWDALQSRESFWDQGIGETVSVAVDAADLAVSVVNVVGTARKVDRAVRLMRTPGITASRHAVLQKHLIHAGSKLVLVEFPSLVLQSGNLLGSMGVSLRNLRGRLPANIKMPSTPPVLEPQRWLLHEIFRVPVPYADPPPLAFPETPGFRRPWMEREVPRRR